MAIVFISVLECCEKPVSKNLFCKNLRLRLPVRSPLYKNLFRLKFETGSCCLKSIKKFCTLGQIRLVNFQDPLWRHRCLIPFNCNVMVCRFYMRNKLNTTKYS